MFQNLGNIQILGEKVGKSSFFFIKPLVIVIRHNLFDVVLTVFHTKYVLRCCVVYGAPVRALHIF